MPGSITRDGKKRLREAASASIGAYFQGLSIQERRTRWIRLGNRYRTNCTSKYEDDLDNSTVDHLSLVAYMGASAPCHAIDGWSFVGRAIDAALRGDTYTAIHLGYYAELRAAMSLLASEGVGIFNRRHATVDARGRTHNFSRTNTHSIIWPCLRHWAGLTKAMNCVDNSIRPANIGLANWLTSLGATIPSRAVAYHWLRSWGMDLADYGDDHNSRNLVSYRPSQFRLPTIESADRVVEYLDELWSSFEPSEGNRFPVMERLLLRRALAAGGVTIPLTEVQLGAVGLQQSEISTWLAVLNLPNEPAFLGEAETRSQIEDGRCHLQVISRATLLLFLATTIVRSQLTAAGIRRDDLSFWWRTFGSSRGLWNLPGPPNPFDIWADIRDRINENQQYIRAQGGGFGLHQMRAELPNAVNFMGAFEIVAIWGLLP